jgi:hypothetical protein
LSHLGFGKKQKREKFPTSSPTATTNAWNVNFYWQMKLLWLLFRLYYFSDTWGTWFLIIVANYALFISFASKFAIFNWCFLIIAANYACFSFHLWRHLLIIISIKILYAETFASNNSLMQWKQLRKGAFQLLSNKEIPFNSGCNPY